MAIIDSCAATRRGACLVVAVLLGMGFVVATQPTGAAEAPVGLGTAASFAVLAGAGVTNTGPSVINGNLGSCPTPALTGFAPDGPGVVNGQTYANTAEACGAQSDLTIAYNDASGRAPNTTYAGPTELGGLTLVPGVYKSPTSFAITGALSLNAQGDPAAVFIFQAGSTLGTAVNSSVQLINGAQACNVFWQVGSSATLGVGSTFVGTILALSDITANTNATVAGRLLARNGAVTLDSNTVTVSDCAPPPTTTSLPPTSTTVAPTTTSSVPVTTTTTLAPTTSTTTAPVTTTTTTAVPATTSTTTAPATTTTTAPVVTTTTLAPAVAANSVTTTSLPTGTGSAVGATPSAAEATAGPGATTASAGRAVTTGTAGSTGAASGGAVSGTTATAGGGGSTTGLTGTGSAGGATSTTSGSAAGLEDTQTLARTGSRLWSETLVGLLAVAIGLLMLSVAGQGAAIRPRRRRVHSTAWDGPVRPPFLLLNEPWTPEKRGPQGQGPAS